MHKTPGGHIQHPIPPSSRAHDLRRMLALRAPAVRALALHACVVRACASHVALRAPAGRGRAHTPKHKCCRNRITRKRRHMTHNLTAQNTPAGPQDRRTAPTRAAGGGASGRSRPSRRRTRPWAWGRGCPASVCGPLPLLVCLPVLTTPRPTEFARTRPYQDFVKT